MDDLDLGSTIKGFAVGQKVFSRYALKRILGRGGMGVVWLARDETLEIDVALKFLPEVVAMDKEAVRDLKRETRRSLELTHPHIIRIYDFVQDGRAAAISMEFVPGDTLAAMKVERGRPFEPADLEKWVEQLCEALAYAHERALVVHRDLKPANLMVDAHGDLKVADFGIAASVSDSVSRVSVRAGSSGTPVYMSPQQMMGDKPAVTDDIYSVGATLYDLITGRPPFHSGNIIAQVQGKVPPRMADRLTELERPVGKIPESWERTVAACLAKEPKDRPQRATEIVSRLREAVVAAPPVIAAVAPAKPPPAPKPVESPKPPPPATAAAKPVAVPPVPDKPKAAAPPPSPPPAPPPPVVAPVPPPPTPVAVTPAPALIAPTAQPVEAISPQAPIAESPKVDVVRPKPSAASRPPTPDSKPTVAPKKESTPPAPAAAKASTTVRYSPGGETKPSAPSKGTALWLGVAAAVVVVAGLGYYFLVQVPAAREAATRSVIAVSRTQLDELLGRVRTGLAGQDWTGAEGALAELDALGATLPTELQPDWEKSRKELRTEFTRARESARLASLRVPVTILTTPEGAEVVIGGQPAGRTPLREVPLALGEHPVVIRRANHEELTTTLKVLEGGQAQWTFPLTHSKGILRLTGDPAGASFKIFPVAESGGRPLMPVADGRLPGQVDLPVGQYEVVVTSVSSGPAISQRSRANVTRNETTSVKSDVRGASAQVVSSPSGATVLVGGKVEGTTPLLLVGQPYGSRQEIELRLDGHVAQKRTIEHLGHADHPQRVEIALNPVVVARVPEVVKPAEPAVSGPAPVAQLRPNLTQGPTRLTLESRVRNTVTITTVDRGTHRSGPTETTSASRELVTLSEPAADGTWRRARSELLDFEGMVPGTILEFARGADRWSPEFARGGFASGNMTAEVFYPAYLGLALSPETVPDVRVAAGAEWNVPLSQTRHVVPGSFFVSPEGTIRGRVKAVDSAANPAWADIEYSFDVRGAVRVPGLTTPAGMRTEVTGRDTGTLTLRLQLREAYVSESRLDRRSVLEGRSTPVGSSLSVAGSSFTHEVASVVETKATPMGGAAAPGALFTRPGGAPAAAQPDGTIYELNQVDRAPRAVSRAAPSYPAGLQRAGVTGSVRIEFVVDAKGAVQHVRALSATHRLFEAPALAAVRTWRFQPAQKGGQPVAVRIEVPIEFNLE